MKIIGDFVTNYILNNQNLILQDKKDWQELSMIILYEIYKVVDAEKQHPEWVDYTIENETQLEDSKNELDLILRNFLIQKINDFYNKYHKSIGPESTVVEANQPFDFRLKFLCE